MRLDSTMIAVVLATFTPIIGLIVAILLERERRKRTEKSPQTEKLLRPPGYSLSLQLDKLFDANRVNMEAGGRLSCVSLCASAFLASWRLKNGLERRLKSGFTALKTALILSRLTPAATKVIPKKSVNNLRVTFV